MNRPEIIGVPAVYYDSEDSRIPGEIRISFEDGTTEVYQHKPSMPAPLIMRNIEIIRKWHGYTPPERRGRHEADQREMLPQI